MSAALVIFTLLAAAPKASFTPVSGLEVMRQAAKNQPLARSGEWVTYRFADFPHRPAKFFRIAAVGEEKDAKGRDSMWFEFEAGEHHEFRAPILQMKMLVAKETGFEPGGVTRILVAVGHSRPQELTPELIHAILTDPNRPSATPTVVTAKNKYDPAFKPTVHVGKPEQLMTYAGTVTATKVEFRVKNTPIKRLWLSEQVPVAHIAKIDLPNMNYTIEVRDYGIAAKPRMVMPAESFPKIDIGQVEKVLSTWPQAEESADEQPASQP